MQVATFADELKNNLSGTTIKPFLATITPGKTGLSKGRVITTKVRPHYYEGVKNTESANTDNLAIASTSHESKIYRI